MGTKKSDFVASPTVGDAAYFDFVINGENIRIAKPDLLAALGVTGTLSQGLPVTAVPVLVVSGTDNVIRNLEAGTNIGLALGPQDQIIITGTTTGGSSAQNILEKTTAYTATITDDAIIANGTFTVTLAPVSSATKSLVIKASVGGGTITVDGNGAETMDGNLTLTLLPGQAVTLVPGTSAWSIGT